MQANPEFQPPPHYLDSIEFVNGLKGKRFIKTHLPWTLLPKQIREGTRKPKVIFMPNKYKI